jgi:hypothetical protein
VLPRPSSQTSAPSTTPSPQNDGPDVVGLKVDDEDEDEDEDNEDDDTRVVSPELGW